MYPDINSGLDSGFGYPELNVPDLGLPDTMGNTDNPTQNPMQALEDYRSKWIEENEQSLDDWEYFYYGIPAGNESFIGVGD